MSRFPHLNPPLLNPEAAQELLTALAWVRAAATLPGPLGMSVKVYSQETKDRVEAAWLHATTTTKS